MVDISKVRAIDIHTHAEEPCGCHPDDGYDELQSTMAKYFGAPWQHPPTISGGCVLSQFSWLSPGSPMWTRREGRHGRTPQTRRDDGNRPCRLFPPDGRGQGPDGAAAW